MSGGGPPPASEQAAFFVHFADDLGGDGMLLSMLLIPHQPLVIEHSSERQKVEIPVLIARCAKALDYDIVAQGNVAADVGSDSTYATPSACAA